MKKVAYVHDWLVTYRGGEKVLEALLEIYPDAPIFTLFYDRQAMPSSIQNRQIIVPQWLQPFKRYRKHLLPLLPFIMESFPLEEFDLVISSSSCVAKGVMTGPETTHISYLHSPMRYIWDQRQLYLEGKNRLVRLLIHGISTMLRTWDRTSSSRIDHIVANSSFVAKRAEKYYSKTASVIHPPIDIAKFSVQPSSGKEGYFLIAGAFVPYKGFDLAIKACEMIGKRLIVAGSGDDETRLRALAGTTTKFIISPSDEKIAQLLVDADALLFPGIEDFGMIAIEAMAAGTPVIAFKKGGALDFVQPGKTGEFFDEPNEYSLSTILENFDRECFEPTLIKQYANKFSKNNFLENFNKQLNQLLESKRN